jgi:hypothetical protein
MKRLRHLARRLVCHWLGCDVNDHPGCDRCGEDLYGSEYIGRGIWPHFLWSITPVMNRFRRPPKCSECGARMYLNERGYFDCPTVDDAHMPF